MPNMTIGRYSHISTFFKGKLYVFGGMKSFEENDKDCLSEKCEYFDFNKK